MAHRPRETSTHNHQGGKSGLDEWKMAGLRAGLALRIASNNLRGQRRARLHQRRRLGRSALEHADEVRLRDLARILGMAEILEGAGRVSPGNFEQRIDAARVVSRVVRDIVD